MSRIRCFWLDETGNVRVWLRRHVAGPCGGGAEYSYHNARFLIGDMAAVAGAPAGEPGRFYLAQPMPAPPPEDPRWPAACETCGYAFKDTDPHQVFQHALYARRDTGEITTVDDAPAGAMWDAWWYRQHGPEAFSFWAPVEGVNLMVKTPGGEWYVDGRASNCDQPDRAHRCWVRHGTVPDITVDKAGDTCGAGAGSIRSGSYHGFLRGGHLEDC